MLFLVLLNSDHISQKLSSITKEKYLIIFYSPIDIPFTSFKSLDLLSSFFIVTLCDFINYQLIGGLDIRGAYDLHRIKWDARWCTLVTWISLLNNWFLREGSKYLWFLSNG
jgi:hypothetical protein